MRSLSTALICSCLLIAGCDEMTSTNPGTGSESVAAPSCCDLVPASVTDGALPLTPENTKILFRGTKPDGAHEGGFNEFAGALKIDEEKNAPTGIEVEIRTESLWSDNDKLTSHLKNPDFFDVNEHPTAKFVSKSVEPAGEEGKYTVTGDLTLLGNTKEIRFPAEVKVGDDGVTLHSEFTFDRTEFGMDYQPEKVHKEVSVTVAVGKK